MNCYVASPRNQRARAAKRHEPVPLRATATGGKPCGLIIPQARDRWFKSSPRNQTFMSRVSGKAYYVYALWSPRDRCFYIGLSENPQKRLAPHNQSGRGWTARHAPWQLVYSECCENYSLAKRREFQLKAQKHGDGFWTVTGLDPSQFSPSSLGS